MYDQIAALPMPSTVHTQRTIRVEHIFWIPPSDPGADVEPQDGDVLLEDGAVIIRLPFDQNGPELTFAADEFLAVVRFLVEEGILEAAGVANPQPAPDAQEGAGEPETVDPALLDDPHWLRLQHVEMGKSMAEIGRMVGRAGITVRKHLEQHGIETRPRGRARDGGFPEGQPA